MAKKPVKGSAKASKRPPPPRPAKKRAKSHAVLPDASRAFPIVGIGASAGGLDAFTQLLKALPTNTGMAFVVVSHLAPTRESLLAEILSRATEMSVMEVTDEPAVLPNHVYVIPPARRMIIKAGALALLPRQKVNGQYRPFDHFLTSLAEDRGHQSVGVVLSGMADDGSVGLEEIKAHGGITFAQDESAQHGEMPRNAIATGAVDFVLPPKAIAREIVRIARHAYVSPEREGGLVVQNRGDDRDIGKILQRLHTVSGVDFSQYKRNTLYRRITRRMVLSKTNDVRDYLMVLKDNAAELEALYQDILINVTSFFRNPEVFDALKSRVFPRIVRNHSRNDPVRMWVLGCSTGEEAYSVAIAYSEFAEQSGTGVPAQVFATDVNGRGIEKARAGVYSTNIVHDVSPERLRRFFHETDGGYRVAKSVRNMCVFARHDGLADPPFSHIDLVCCRNLLIYLEPGLQRRFIPLLHYALNPGGFMLLGGSETIGSYGEYFEVEDAKHRLYTRKPTAPRLPQPMRMYAFAPRRNTGAKAETDHQPGTTDARHEVDRILLSRFAPAAVLIDANNEIMHFRGDTGRYLSPTPGKASLNLLKMVREGLAISVRAGLNKARKGNTPLRLDGLRMKRDGASCAVKVEIIPLHSDATHESALVLFQDDEQERLRSPVAGAGRAASRSRERIADGRVEQTRLERELSATQNDLQSVIEQQEAANEELQSANEEVQSANEELQSINEELETSKEEIQSSNEELATVNDELRNRNAELAQSNSDFTNLLSSVQMAIVMLGPDLRIRLFTPVAERLLNLIAADVGRPITDIKMSVDIPDLEPLLVEVMESMEPVEREARDRSGRWFSVRIRPYRTIENKSDGVVLLLVDVDALKRSEETVRQNEERLRVVQDEAPLGNLRDHAGGPL